MTFAKPTITPIVSRLAAPVQPDPASTALFLDIDGTLLDFAASPAQVHVDPMLPSLLQAVARRLDGALALISGRPLCEIDALLRLRSIAAAGLHGAELRGADGTLIATVRDSARMQALRTRAGSLVSELAGVFVETKPDALALHYRNAPDNAAAVRAIADLLAREAGAEYVLQPGNHVIELKRAGCDKGRAVATLLHTLPFAGRMPWVFGDDLTDEHAFAIANAQCGISVIVGPRRPTAACRALADPRAMLAWLALLRDQAPPHPHGSISA